MVKYKMAGINLAPDWLTSTATSYISCHRHTLSIMIAIASPSMTLRDISANESTACGHAKDLLDLVYS